MSSIEEATERVAKARANYDHVEQETVRIQEESIRLQTKLWEDAQEEMRAATEALVQAHKETARARESADL